MKCRITNKNMENLFSLGNLYISDFVKPNFNYNGIPKPELKLQLSEDTHCLQLADPANIDLIYENYWYRSEASFPIVEELKDLAESCMKLSRIKSDNEKIFLDIASNDGTLLNFVNKKVYKRIGIDPLKDVQEGVSKKCELAIQGFFSKEIYRSYNLPKASIITSAALFPELYDPVIFLNDVHQIIEDDGLFVIQQIYMPLMIKQLFFNNICHEQIFYHSLYSMEFILNNAGFKIIDVQLSEVSGGNFRIYAQKKIAKSETVGSSIYRNVGKMRVESLREYEKTLKLGEKSIYMKFWNDISKLKSDVMDNIHKIKKNKKSIWIYGASTKGNTLLQWFGLDSKIIDGSAEISSDKFGLKTIGTNIFIYPEEKMRKIHPDYLLILPWPFVNEFKEIEKKYLEKGGKFIVPCPKFEII